MFFFSFGGINVDSVHYWHPEGTISCNLALSKLKFFTSAPTMEGPQGSTIFIELSHKWITKSWQVWETRFCFICNSIFLFSFSCLRQNYDFWLKVSKKLLSLIFKFNMISAWYLPLRAVFYWFYDTIVDIVFSKAEEWN